MNFPDTSNTVSNTATLSLLSQMLRKAHCGIKIIPATTGSFILISINPSYCINTIGGEIYRVGSFDGLEYSCWEGKLVGIKDGDK